MRIFGHETALESPTPRRRVWGLAKARSGFGVRRRAGGAIMIEMVVVFPVLLYLMLGMVEYGQYFYIRHILESACRDATRASIPATAQSGDPAAAATLTLGQASIPYNDVTLLIQDTANGWATVTDVSSIPAGHNLEVTLTATYAQLPGAYRPFNSLTGLGISTSKQIQCISMMTKE
jgi:Flp pilus assembly protein TadG